MEQSLCEELVAGRRVDQDISVDDLTRLTVDNLSSVTAYCDRTDSDIANLFNVSPRTRLVSNILYSGLWGGLEGIATGSLIGPTLMVSGGWVIGSLGDLFGFIVGASYGAIGGTVLGLLSGDWRTVARNVWSYRNTMSSSYVSPEAVRAMDEQILTDSET